MTYFIDTHGKGDCLPRDDEFGSEFKVYEEVAKVYPRNEWNDILESHRGMESLVKKIKNQGREGTCASNATGQCLEVAWNQVFGDKMWVEFSPISIYRWIAPGPSSGSTISGNLRQLRDVGMLPVRTDRNLDLLRKAGLPEHHVLTATGYYQDFPSGWKETAEFFRGLEFMDISSFEGMVSAIFEGFPVCYGRAGHAICGVKVVWRNGAWHIKYANSWGNWGEDGYGYDSERFISRAIRSYGAWALRTPRVVDRLLELQEAVYGTEA